MRLPKRTRGGEVYTSRARKRRQQLVLLAQLPGGLTTRAQIALVLLARGLLLRCARATVEMLVFVLHCPHRNRGSGLSSHIRRHGARPGRELDHEVTAARRYASRCLSFVGFKGVATTLNTSSGASHRSSTPRRRRRRLHRDGNRHPVAPLPQATASSPDAAAAVALAFARVMAERYPGTNWLPTKRSRSDDRLVVPAGKVIRLLSGPADMDTSGGIGHPAAPTAYERAPHEHGADTGA